jgi:predicted nucleic acid-binding protein
MNAAAQAAFPERLRRLPVAIEHRPATWLAHHILPLSRTCHLSADDAAYPELAIREGLPIATLDEDRPRAASAAGVALFDPA